MRSTIRLWGADARGDAATSIVRFAVSATVMVTCAWASHVLGASTRQAPAFRGGVETVEVAVTVTDAAGRLVTGLERDDFRVFEDGAVQPVTHFTGARLPVSLGLLLDVSDSMVGQPLSDVRAAVDHFVGEWLRPEDEAFVATFNHVPRLIVPWTTPPAALRGRLAGVHASGSTAMYDALAAAAPLFDERAHTRAALVVISDGADTASDITLGRARDVLQRADPFVYAVAIDASTHPREASRVNPEALRQITGPSGGYTEVVRDAADLGPATERIADELSHQYALGYTAPRAPDGQWRSIQVRMRNPDHRARARRGYFAVPGPRARR